MLHSWWDFGSGFGFSGETLALYRTTCPFCGEKGNFDTVDHKTRQKPNSRKILNYDTLKCTNCGNLTFAFWAADESYSHHRLHNFKTLPYRIGVNSAPDYWPVAVQRHWIQAHKSLEGGNYDAAVVMARSAMQASLRDSGAKKGRLVEEIKDLAAKGLLPPLMEEWAGEVRLLGNESAHPDPSDEGVSSDDAKDMIEFLDYLLQYLYDLPKQIEDYRKRKEPQTQEEDA